LLEPRAVQFGGHSHVIRLLGPADEGRLISFFNSHTGETIHQRYGYRISEMTHERAQRLVGVDQSRDVALGVFERATDGEEVLHAVGRYLLDATGRSAEMAFVVRETKRGLGICTALVRRLLLIARARGMSYLFAQVQADKHPHARGFPAPRRPDAADPGADATEAFRANQHSVGLWVLRPAVEKRPRRFSEPRKRLDNAGRPDSLIDSMDLPKESPLDARRSRSTPS